MAGRLPASRIAGLVYGQERLEGDLRTAHLRLRAWSMEITLASCGPAEAEALELPLAAVLGNMRSIIDVGWLLSVSTHALGYAGALLNYSCIGLAMLHGAYPRSSPDAGVFHGAGFLALSGMAPLCRRH